MYPIILSCQANVSNCITSSVTLFCCLQRWEICTSGDYAPCRQTQFVEHNRSSLFAGDQCWSKDHVGPKTAGCVSHIRQKSSLMSAIVEQFQRNEYCHLKRDVIYCILPRVKKLTTNLVSIARLQSSNECKISIIRCHLRKSASATRSASAEPQQRYHAGYYFLRAVRSPLSRNCDSNIWGQLS